MINDLSLALKELLRSVAKNEPQTFPLLQGKEIEFARPDKDYKPKANGSVCVFLYDIRENRELRSNEPLRVNSNGQPAIARPPTRVVCSYLITAWPAEAVGDDLNLLEQQLLSEVLILLSRYPTIPVDALGGKLANPEQPVPPPMITAQAEGLNNISEFWTAIGSNLRPSLNVKATIAMQVSPPEAEAKRPTERILREDKPARLPVKGQVNDEKHVPIKGARIAIVELGLSTTSDRDGQYAFSDVPIGKYNLSINWRADEKLARRNLEISVPGAPGAYDLNGIYPVAGQLTDDKVAVAGATITILQLNLSSTSDDKGQFRFESVLAGKYNLRVKWTSSGNQKSKDVEVTVPALAGAYDLELKG
jgi:protocatechuate 3,4-dioxygenase beta subunit